MKLPSKTKVIDILKANDQQMMSGLGALYALLMIQSNVTILHLLGAKKHAAELVAASQAMKDAATNKQGWTCYLVKAHNITVEAIKAIRKGI